MPNAEVRLDNIVDNPFNTRSAYADDAVEELACAIERDGMLSTPTARVVTAGGDVVTELLRADVVQAALDAGGRVELASGGTRRRAWELVWQRHAERSAGLQEPGAAGDAALPSGLRGCAPDRMLVRLAAITDDGMERAAWEENERRRDLDPVDRAAAIASRVERHGWTHEEAGAQLGLDRSTVSNILRWHTAFTEGGDAGAHALALLRAGTLAEAGARALAGMFELARAQPDVYRHLVSPAASPGRIDDLASFVRWIEVVEPRSASIRERLDRWRAAFERETQRRERERAPDMFDDDGAELAAVAEARGMEPHTAAPSADVPDKNIEALPPAADVERIAEGTGAQMEPAEGGTLDDEADDEPPTVIAEIAGLWPRPEPHPDAESLESLTKASIEKVYRRYRSQLACAGQHHFYQSARKADMVKHVRRTIEQAANVQAAMELTDGQVDQVARHLHEGTTCTAVVQDDDGTPWYRVQVEPDLGLSHAAREAWQAANHDARVAGLSGAARGRHFRGAIRRLLATCYLDVLGAMGALDEAPPADVSADVSGNEPAAAEVLAGHGLYDSDRDPDATQFEEVAV